MSRQLTSGVLGRKKGIDADLQVYLDILTQPLSSKHIALLNTFVKDLKSGLGIKYLSDAFDVMYVMANETEEAGLKNLIKRAHDATPINSPYFEQYVGFLGNGSSSHIETNYTPYLDSDKYKLIDASHGCYINFFDNSINDFIYGVYSTIIDGGTDKMVRLASGGTERIMVSVNSGNTNASFIDGIEPDKGHWIQRRNNPSDYELIYNDETPEVFAIPSSGLPNQKLTLLARRTVNESVGLFSKSQLSFFFLGKYLTDIELNILKNTFDNYMNLL